MGCTASVCMVGTRRKKLSIPEIAVFVPSMRVPVQSNLQRALKGLVPRYLVDRLSALRNQILLLAEDTDGSAANELKRPLEEYLSLVIGLTKKEHGLVESVEFKWKNLCDGWQESSMANSWLELLSIIHMMAMVALFEADSLMIPKDCPGSEVRTVSADCKRNAVDLLLKASGYLDFCIREVLIHIPPGLKDRLPIDLQDGVLEATYIQALGQGTEIQLGLAVESQTASLSVKRRLACEQLTYFSQAYTCLSECDLSNGYGKKQLLFIKWKYLEAKAASYYYHGQIVDKANEPSCHVSAFFCFLAAEELLAESKKACLSFCLAVPVSRIPPLWGVMKYLYQKIPEVVSRKSQTYGYLLEQEKALQTLPDLPEFQLSLRPDDYELPEIDPVWDCGKWEIESQTLKEHLKDYEDEIES
ncbi:uncharacterized protein LOC115739004 [Rhodamnia argentea]|uniref:Uncharacterized protein LOC115739004 n=1 Tax=Rhodamnia argentea TaxID=178133 RepID=A0A8B8NYS1_9MYRT|nr:uncharacterized protein LOC115739004 [Rhodamnia argentea]XP_030527704.1 uncharacterized protein LOC115739004 [Rhodamnia argentea]XP_030527705.1 uncharacterized protein LOC115739004 [Rhodamnia argentea]XP_030527706.1 uncharacterized protein LOC115739004 [Rhodamnia argentea]XP_048141792.1 uncharacterized protein LOC115739004 [Rhodamnia argentea]